MKTIKQKINRAVIILIVLCTTALLNCSKDDSDGTSEDQTITFMVELIKITGVETQGDGNSALEVYGSITASLNFGTLSTEEILWNKAQEDYVSIEVADFPIASSKIFEVLESELSNVSINVNANLMEYDSNVNNADDPIGNESLTTLLSGLTQTTTYNLLLDETDNQEVQVTYSIARL